MNLNLRQNPNPFLSVITPVLNETALIEPLVNSLLEALSALTHQFEIIIIDDGSQDGTAEAIKQMEEKYPKNIKLIKFSRNFGKENALTAGLQWSSGDAVILVDADLQHPLDMLPKFLEKWREGYDNVYGVCIRTPQDQNFLGRFCAESFYTLNRRLLTTPIPANAGDFRLLDRNVVEAILALPERTRFMKGLYAWVGFKSIGLTYRILPRGAGRSRFNFIKLMNLALTGITAFSNAPLRIWSFIGIGISGCSLLYALFLTIQTLIYGRDVSGWSTLAVGLFFLGGIGRNTADFYRRGRRVHRSNF
jgi:glycosyltransferase involved in cell wall biosynthesis